MIQKGQKINDRYQIIKSIGEGGMANVYLAFDTILERNVAVKVLRGDLANDEKFVRRFQREALSASSLSHPNIVEVYDVGEDNGIYYIVMEYIEGKHLKQLLKRRGKLTTEEAVDIMLQVTDGMACAHDSYIIHRDIKPQNIMILENGLVKITDFGIAMALNSTQLTQTNSVMGSVHYLPPEQASGKGSTIQSDVYSMGILFYELLTGTLPYKGDNAVEIALKHLKDPLPSIREELPNIPVPVENIILKACAKNPKNRYADAREMHEDLKTCLDKSRANEPKYVYNYPEYDEKEKKEKVISKSLPEEKTVKKEVVDVKKITEKEIDSHKKENKTLVVLAFIFAALVVITTSVVLLIPKLTSSKDLVVPDVSNMTVDEAIDELTKLGLRISAENKTTTSETIEKGKIVKTSPNKGRTVKKGSEVVLYESIGSGTITLEDYTGKNYIETKTILEQVHKLFVIQKTEEVKNGENYEKDEIIRQEPAAGAEVKEGDTITLYVPDVTDVYPDFTNGSYSLKDIEAFCKKYKLELQVEYKSTDEYEQGAIISQTRLAGSSIISNMTLKIIIAEAPDPDTVDE